MEEKFFHSIFLALFEDQYFSCSLFGNDVEVGQIYNFALQSFLETKALLLLFTVLCEEEGVIVDFLDGMRSYSQVDRVLMLSVGSLLVGHLVIVFDGGVVVIFFMQVMFLARTHYFTF